MEEMARVERRDDGVKGEGHLVVVETVRQIIGIGIRVAERGQIVSGLNEFENAAKVVCGVRNVSSLGVR